MSAGTDRPMGYKKMAGPRVSLTRGPSQLNALQKPVQPLWRCGLDYSAGSMMEGLQGGIRNARDGRIVLRENANQVTAQRASNARPPRLDSRPWAVAIKWSISGVPRERPR